MTSFWSTAHPSQPRFLGIAAAVVVFGTAALSGCALYVSARDAMVDEVRTDLRRTAVIAASSIDARLHRQLTDPSQEDGPLYRQAITPLRNILRSAPSIRFLYTFIMKDGEIHFVLDATPKGDADRDGKEDHSFLMDRYDEDNPVLRSVLEGGPAATEA